MRRGMYRNNRAFVQIIFAIFRAIFLIIRAIVRAVIAVTQAVVRVSLRLSRQFLRLFKTAEQRAQELAAEQEAAERAKAAEAQRRQVAMQVGPVGMSFGAAPPAAAQAPAKPQTGGGGSSAIGSLLGLLIIFAVIFTIGKYVPFVDRTIVQPVSNILSPARAAVESKIPLQSLYSIPGSAYHSLSEMWYNPAGAFEEEATTETSTKTSSGAGIKVTSDDKDRTGIISPNPRSDTEYTIMVGVKNPTKDYVAANSKLFLGNPGNLTKKTKMEFNDFKWDDGNAAMDIGTESYAAGSADSKVNAITITKTEDVGNTTMNLEVDYSYDFMPAAKISMLGLTITTQPPKKINDFVMYNAKFLVGSPKNAQDIEKCKGSYKLKDRAAGGPVAVTRKEVQPYLEPGKRVYLIFTIKNADANSGVFEAIDFETGDIPAIYLLVPKEFKDPQPSSKFGCAAVPNTQYEQYQACPIKSHILFPNSNLKNLREKACSADGCYFNGYATAQGFFDVAGGLESRILTDESGSNEAEFSVSFKVDEDIDPDKVYNVYLLFTEGAYRYHAVMRKLIGVQPG